MRIFHQCRKDDIDSVKSGYDGCAAEITVSHFFDNMADLYAQTSLIISRAGASSIAEITATRLPSILIPLPTAADDHQTTNAEAIGKKQAGHVLTQQDFSAETLRKLLSELINDENQLQDDGLKA